MFARAAKLTNMSAKFLDAIQPADFNSGWDLSTPGGQRAWKHIIRIQNPGPDLPDGAMATHLVAKRCDFGSVVVPGGASMD